jgi:hypothetical protein
MWLAAQGWVSRLALVLALGTLGGLGATALAPSAALATYLPQERVPTNHPVYRDIDRLIATYDRTPRAYSTKPLRLQELLSYLNSLVIEQPSAANDPAMIRARRYLDPEAPRAKKPFLRVAGDGDEVITVSPYGTAVYDEDPKNRPEDLNRDYRIGGQIAAATDSTTLFLLDAYWGTASQGGRGTPNFGTLNAAIEGEDLNSWMEEAYLEFAVSKLRVLIGHTWLRWGPGREGTLALSDAAPALDMVRLEAGFTRQWRGQSFVALLDPGPQTYLAGHRLEWTFKSDLRIAVTEMARFDGTSQVLMYSIPVVPYSLWEKRRKTVPVGAVPGDTTGLALAKNNCLVSVDLAWNVRPGFRLWGEFMVDDISFSSDYKPDMIGWQAGAEERWILGGAGGGTPRATTLSVEYNRVNNYVYSAWHGHDFGLNGFPIGFGDGPDVMQVALEAGYEHNADIEVRLRAEVRKKGEGAVGDPWLPSQGKVDAGVLSGVVERDARIAARVIYSPSRLLRLDATVGFAKFKNEDHQNVGEEDEVPFRLAAHVEW